MGDLTVTRERADPHERGSKAGCGDAEFTPGAPSPGAGERDRVGRLQAWPATTDERVVTP
jgi:hypothetical protein